MSLPLSLEIFATDIFLGDNEGAILEIREGGGKPKNTSCSELGDENASCSELRGLQLQGVRWFYRCCSLPGLQARTCLAKPISPTLTLSDTPHALPNWQWVVPTQHYNSSRVKTYSELLSTIWCFF